MMFSSILAGRLYASTARRILHLEWITCADGTKTLPDLLLPDPIKCGASSFRPESGTTAWYNMVSVALHDKQVQSASHSLLELHDNTYSGSEK